MALRRVRGLTLIRNQQVVGSNPRVAPKNQGFFPLPIPQILRGACVWRI
jgi:hypothetical protein